ncbi:hypothetical protein C8F01DRAFT_1009987 [Mycena amicta]|nr:hypothetical protein C8F01DRAFT_1009987 [Mycena amicta]
MAARRTQDRNRLVVVDAEIAKMELELTKLRTERSDIRGRLAAYAYPVLTLPTELVVEIFMQYLPVYPACPPLFGRDSPTHLTHICHLWRSIALSTPMLWRAIEFDGTSSEGGRPEEDALRVVRTWLLRSDSCRLSLSILGIPQRRSNFSMRRLMWVLLPHQQRWEYINFAVFVSTPNEIIPISGPLPALVELNAWGSFQVSVASNAPLLHTLHAFVHPSAIGPSNPNEVNWVQLTTLTLQHKSLGECIEILQNTINLRHCSLHVPRDTTSLPAILWLPPTLQTFIMDFSRNPSSLPLVVGYLRRIVAGPALQRLRIPSIFLQPNPIEVLGAFLAVSKCPLQNLQLVGRSKPYIILGEELQPLFPAITKMTKVPRQGPKPLGQPMDEFFDEAKNASY